MSIRQLIHQMSHKRIQSRIFGAVWLQKVYESGWEAKSEYQLMERIKLKLKKFDLDFVKSLMGGVKAKLRKIGQKGVFSLHK